MECLGSPKMNNIGFENHGHFRNSSNHDNEGFRSFRVCGKEFRERVPGFAPGCQQVPSRRSATGCDGLPPLGHLGQPRVATGLGGHFDIQNHYAIFALFWNSNFSNSLWENPKTLYLPDFDIF